jgi:hypothetical protein
MQDGEESNLYQETNTMTEEVNKETPTANSMVEQVSNDGNTATATAPEGELVSLTGEQLQNRYRNGFRVAVNYLYHRQPSDADKANFKTYLETVMPAEHVEEALKLSSTMEPVGSCPAGSCPDGMGGCVPCTFDLAFDEGYFSEPI